MRSKLLNRKKWSDESGVSEIIGNILILMITVVLFTGIIAFVNQMPVPEMTIKADFSANVDFTESGSVADITVTHRGGAVLDAKQTVVLVSIDSTTHSYRLSDDIGYELDRWATGGSWTKQFTGTDYSSIIFVTVIDDVRHSAIWTSQLSGGAGGNPPTILQRYVDSVPDTMTVDPVRKGDSFTLYVKVSDQDNDLQSVWVDSSSLEGGQSYQQFDRPTTGVVSPLGGWFEWDFGADFTTDVTKIDGRTLMIYAMDAAGHTTAVPFRLSIVVLPVDTIEKILPDIQPGGMPSYIKNVNEGQGFAVFGEDVPNATANINDPRTTFIRGETVFVRVASLYVLNTDGGNELTLIDARTKTDYTALAVFRPPSETDTPFYHYAYGGNVAVFEAVFNTTDMMPGTYTMIMFIQGTGASTYSFSAEQTLYIDDPDSPITYKPTILAYRDSGYSQDWGYSRETTFNATGENYKVYVAIRVQDTDANPSMGEVRIVDMTGGTQLSGPPGSGEMIGPVERYNETAYVFWIDLRYSNGDLWKTGTNSYTLQISQFSDLNEGVYSYSRQVFVKGFTSRADFVLGTNGLYSTKGGSTNFISPEYVFYVENNNFFTKRTLYYQENAPSTAPLFYHNAMALGDLDNDGDLDLLVGSNMDQTGSYPSLGQLLYFENSLSTYGIWQAPSVITRPAGDSSTTKIEWIDMGDINGDGYTDFAYSTNDHKVVIFNNTYGTVGSVFKTWAAAPTPAGVDGIRKIALRDMTGDGRADLIVLVNGMVEMYDLTKWTAGRFATLPDPAVATPANIEDFDIADVNNDGMLDIITVDPDGNSHVDIRGVWVNNYTENPDVTRTRVSGLVSYDGWVVAGDYSSTWYEDETPFSLTENITGEDEGRVSFVLSMDPLPDDTDPQLVVRAKLSQGSTEVFYVWYTTDTGTDPKYTPVMVISGSTYTDFRYNLPAKVAGEHNFKLKITDSSLKLGTVDQIDIDYIAIESNRFGTYWPNPMTDPPTRYQIVDQTYGYICVRAINFDGLDDGRLEVVAAKNGQFAVYDYKTQVATWLQSVANMQVSPVAGSGLSNQVSISPTLFEVADINGDGLSDILVTSVSVGDSYEASLLTAYINVGPDYAPWVVNIKDLFAGFLATSEKGSIVKIAAGDIFIRR